VGDNYLCVSKTGDFRSGIFTFSGDGKNAGQTCVSVDEHGPGQGHGSGCLRGGRRRRLDRNQRGLQRHLGLGLVVARCRRSRTA